jgi:hypothetical protein
VQGLPIRLKVNHERVDGQDYATALLCPNIDGSYPYTTFDTLSVQEVMDIVAANEDSCRLNSSGVVTFRLPITAEQAERLIRKPHDFSIGYKLV